MAGLPNSAHCMSTAQPPLEMPPATDAYASWLEREVSALVFYETRLAASRHNAGQEIIESADEIMETITEDVPAAASSIRCGMSFSCLDAPGVRVATTVLKRGESSS